MSAATVSGPAGGDVTGGEAMSRERRCGLLAVADADALVHLADRCLADGVAPTLLAGPEVGLTMLDVREPVCGDRFYLGEVLVTSAEIELGGARGWAMRMGSDREATLAAAVCDAEVEAARALAGEVEQLCHRTAAAVAGADAVGRAELAATEVHFEELDL